MKKGIRVYELAKELNTTSKKVIAVLAEKNIEVTTHMATLEENQASMVRKELGDNKPAKEEARPADGADKEPKAAPKKKKFIVVHNPENSRDKKSPERRKTQNTRPQPRKEAPVKQEAKPEVKAEREEEATTAEDRNKEEAVWAVR